MSTSILHHMALLLIVLHMYACTNDAKKYKNKDAYSNTSSNLFLQLASSQTNINFYNHLVETEDHNFWKYQYYYNGGGVAVGDVNNDGLPDIYFTGNNVADQLYLNKGNLQFDNITAQAGINDKNGWSSGVTMADVNADGLLDIYVCKSGPHTQKTVLQNKLYINQGNATFKEMAVTYGLADDAYSVQAAFFDYDLDGDLDMYLANHANIFRIGGVEYFQLRKKYNPQFSDKLYQNQGNNNFTEVGAQAGIHNFGFGLGLSIGDLNNDNWPDVYVANDFAEHDFYYINNQDGTFTESFKQHFKHGVYYGMGADIADINNDGFLDVFVVDMLAEDDKRAKTLMPSMRPNDFYATVESGLHYQYMFNALQINNGNGSFSEIGKLAGIDKTDWSWATLAADFDNDGYNDIAVTNGYLFDVQERDFTIAKATLGEEKGYFDMNDINQMKSNGKLKSTKIANYMFRNNGDFTFSKVSEKWGFNFKGFSNGLAYADLDLDGDLDLVTNHINDTSHIHKNLTTDKQINNYLRIQPVNSHPKNRQAIGAKLIATVGKQTLIREVYTSRGFQSASESIVHFGLGDKEQVEKLQIIWPDGSKQIVANIKANQVLKIEKEANFNKVSSPKDDVSSKLFTELNSNELFSPAFQHQEKKVNDFERETLLPHKFSQTGPALAVADINKDGLDDIYLGGAAEQAGVIYLQNKSGNYVKMLNPDFDNHAFLEDTDAAFFDADADGDMDLYVCSGSNEFKNKSVSYLDRLYLNLGADGFRMPKNILPEITTSTACVKPCDYDNDGDVDLFVGGQIVPGKYPFAPRSYLLENNKGQFKDVTAIKAPELYEAGLIKDATWADVNNDNQTDLIVVGEWMPILLMINKDRGQEFVNKSEAYGLANNNGWWRSISAADFDKDGDIDLVAGNIGLNTKFKASKEKPFWVYCNDFDENGSLDIVLAKYNKNGDLCPVRGKECSTEQMPFLSEKFTTYNAFAEANLANIYGEEKLKESLQLPAHTFASSYFENKGNQQFNKHTLPMQAQWFPINDILVADFNNDQNLDVLLTGNLYQTEVETPRYDAGNGLLLAGDGQGIFKPIDTNDSGFYTPLDAQKMQLVTHTANKKTQVVVVNNNEACQLFSCKVLSNKTSTTKP